MRGAAVGVILALVAAVPAQAAYSGVTGGTASPAKIAPGGATDYGITLTGKAKPVDVVFVIDASGSMATTLSGGGTSRATAIAAATDNEIDALSAAGLFTRGGDSRGRALLRFCDDRRGTDDGCRLAQAGDHQHRAQRERMPQLRHSAGHRPAHSHPGLCRTQTDRVHHRRWQRQRNASQRRGHNRHVECRAHRTARDRHPVGADHRPRQH